MLSEKVNGICLVTRKWREELYEKFGYPCYWEEVAASSKQKEGSGMLVSPTRSRQSVG